MALHFDKAFAGVDVVESMVSTGSHEEVVFRYVFHLQDSLQILKTQAGRQKPFRIDR